MNNKWSVASKVRKGITFGKSKISFKDIGVVIIGIVISFAIYKFFPISQFLLALLCILAVWGLLGYMLIRPKDNPELRNYDLFIAWNFNGMHRKQKRYYKKFEMKDLEK